MQQFSVVFNHSSWRVDHAVDIHLKQQRGDDIDLRAKCGIDINFTVQRRPCSDHRLEHRLNISLTRGVSQVKQSWFKPSLNSTERDRTNNIKQSTQQRSQEVRPTLPAFHVMGVDLDDGSPVSVRWNSFVMHAFSKYGLVPKCCKSNAIKSKVRISEVL